MPPTELIHASDATALAASNSHLAADKNALVLFFTQISKSSRRTMTYVLQSLADRLGYEDVPIQEVPWLELKPAHVSALIGLLRDEGITPNYASLHIAAIRGIFNAAFINNLIDGDTLLRMRSIKGFTGHRIAKGKNLQRSLISELLKSCDEDERTQGLRDAALISVLYGSGMRRAESVRFMLSDVDFEQHTIQVIGKGNKEMLKHLPAWAIKRLEKWIEYREQYMPGCDFLFNRIYKGGKIAPDRLTIDGVYHIVSSRGMAIGHKITPHDFRRSFITRIISEHDLSMAQKMADHSSPSTTARYDMRGEDKKRSIMESYDL